MPNPQQPRILGGRRGPSPEWHERPRFGNLAAGLIAGHRAPDEKHGGSRLPYKAEPHEVPGLLADGWEPDDPAILDELDLATDAQ